MKHALRALVLLLTAVTLVVIMPFQVFAAVDGDLTPVGPDAQSVDTALFNLSPFVVSFILGSLVPIVNGLLTKITTPTKWKALITIALDAVVGLITVSLVDGGGAVFSQSAVVAAIMAFFASVASYYQVWRPLAITSSKVSRIGDNGQPEVVPGKLANVGVS